MRQHRTLLVACVAMFLAGSAVTAWAGHVTSSVPSYTGCLTTSTGALSKLKRGNNPLTPCASGEVRVHLSGGDITSVLPAAGGGLAGGASQGQVELGLDSATLQRIKCAALPRWYVDLSGCFLTGATLSGMNLSYANLSDASLNGDDLTSADLTGANLTGATLGYAELTSATLLGANLSNANLANATMSKANLNQATLVGTYFFRVILSNANLTDANLTNADLTLANLSDADLTGADLTNVTWYQTTCPDGTRSDTNGTNPQSCVGHGV